MNYFTHIILFTEHLIIKNTSYNKSTEFDAFKLVFNNELFELLAITSKEYYKSILKKEYYQNYETKIFSKNNIPYLFCNIK